MLILISRSDVDGWREGEKAVKKVKRSEVRGKKEVNPELDESDLIIICLFGWFQRWAKLIFKNITNKKIVFFFSTGLPTDQSTGRLVTLSKCKTRKGNERRGEIKKKIIKSGIKKNCKKFLINLILSMLSSSSLLLIRWSWW